MQYTKKIRYFLSRSEYITHFVSFDERIVPEKWTDWLWYECTYSYIDQALQRNIWYLPAYYSFSRYSIVMVIAPLYPLALVYRTFSEIWWRIARLCYMKGVLSDINESVAIYWFWPKYLKPVQKIKTVVVNVLKKHVRR